LKKPTSAKRKSRFNPGKKKGEESLNDIGTAQSRRTELQKTRGETERHVLKKKKKKKTKSNKKNKGWILKGRGREGRGEGPEEGRNGF